MFGRPENSSQLLRTINIGLSPFWIFSPPSLILNYPCKNTSSSSSLFVASFLFWLCKSHKQQSGFASLANEQVISCTCEGKIYYRSLILPCTHLILIIKGVCHRKAWGGKGAEGSGLVLITCKGSSGADPAKDLQRERAVGLGWGPLLLHDHHHDLGKALHPADPQFPSHEMGMENLPLFLA